MEGMMSDPDPESSSPREPPAAPEPRSAAVRRLAELAAEARPAEVSDGSKQKLLEDWAKAGGYIERAEQMRLDAIKEQAKCAEKIVRKLGAGMFRYKDKLYMATVSKKGVIYLREAVARRKDG